MGGDDGSHQAWETLFQFRAARDVVHFDAVALAVNQSSLAENLEMLREGRLGDGFIAHLQKVRAALRALLGNDAGVHGGSNGVGQCVQNSFHRHVLHGRVEEGPHT